MPNQTEFHTYAVEWHKDSSNHTILEFYLDENKHYTLDLEATYGEFVKFFVSPNYEWYVILNLAVGGNWPGSAN